MYQTRKKNTLVYKGLNNLILCSQMLLTNFQLNPTYYFGSRRCLKIFKMAAMSFIILVIMDIRTEKFQVLWISMLPWCSAPDNFDYNQYRYLMRTSYFQSVHVFIFIYHMLSPNFYESLYLYLKGVMLLLSSCLVWSPINQNGDVPMHVNRDACLLPSVNTLRF